MTRMPRCVAALCAGTQVVYYVRRTPPDSINMEYLAAKRAAMHTELAVRARMAPQAVPCCYHRDNAVSLLPVYHARAPRLSCGRHICRGARTWWVVPSPWPTLHSSPTLPTTCAWASTYRA